MRVTLRGVTRADDAFTFSYNGREIPAFPGESVAAALLCADEAVCRKTAFGEGRGMFCGMGVCFDCLVQIDGRPNRQACLTRLRDGMRVETQIGDGTWDDDDEA